jgi:hypothetical protein
MPFTCSICEVIARLDVPSVANEADLNKLVRSTSATFESPQDSGRSVALARQILYLISEGPWAFVVLEHGIWPSSEMVSLFDRLRKSEGIEQGLAEARCEIVELGGEDYLTCAIACGFFFCWSFALISLETKSIFYASHDEWFTVWSPDKRILKGYTSEFKRWLE